MAAFPKENVTRTKVFVGFVRRNRLENLPIGLETGWKSNVSIHLRGRNLRPSLIDALQTHEYLRSIDVAQEVGLFPRLRETEYRHARTFVVGFVTVQLADDESCQRNGFFVVPIANGHVPVVSEFFTAAIASQRVSFRLIRRRRRSLSAT